jgi:hypothetical protein
MLLRLEQLDAATAMLRQAHAELDLIGGGCGHMNQQRCCRSPRSNQALWDYLCTLSTLASVSKGASCSPCELMKIAAPGDMCNMSQIGDGLTTLAAVAGKAERASVTEPGRKSTNGGTDSRHASWNPSQSHSDAILSVFRLDREATLSRCRLILFGLASRQSVLLPVLLPVFCVTVLVLCAFVLTPKHILQPLDAKMSAVLLRIFKRIPSRWQEWIHSMAELFTYICI